MFEQRAQMLEVLDSPCVDHLFAERSYRFMRWVNRFLGGCRIVRRYLATESASAPRGRPLRVLDMGSGSCDIPLLVSRWATRRGCDIEFTCLDVLPQAETLARRDIESSQDPNVKFVREDIFHHEPKKAYDCAIGSMFFHHLRDEQILELIGHIRGYVRRSLLINDLRRDAMHYVGACLLRVSASSDLLKDALLSIRRGFRADELAALLANVEGACVKAGNAWMYRVWATVCFDSGEGKCGY
jgi:hypothetical protein